MADDIFGFDQLEAKLQDILDRSPKVRDKFVAQEAELLEGRIKDNTPVDTGTLRNGWKHTKASEGSARVYINTRYAAHVEFGHRIKRGGKWIRGPNGKVRFVKGAKMLHKGLQESEQTFKEDAGDIMKGLLR